MASFKFNGFETGEPVTLSLQQGADTANGSVPTWSESGPSTMTVALSGSRMSGVAPMGVLLTADSTSSESRVVSPYHDIEGHWSFDDPGNFSTLVNSPIWGADRNTGYGPRTTHVFSEPGTYEVIHTAFDGAGSLTETITITVEDPDVVFAGADTAVVSQSGNFAGAPSGAAQFASVAAAMSHLSGRQNQRLLLRATETFTDGIAFQEDGGSNRRLHVGRFGHTGNQRPTLDMRVSGDDGVFVRGSSWAEIAVADLRIEGAFDPTASSQPNPPDGNGINLSGNFSTEVPGAAQKTVWNCEIRNIGGMGISCEGASEADPNRYLYVGDTSIIGWFNYGIQAGDLGDWGLSGVTLRQPEGTVNGTGKSGAPHFPDHGPMRLSRPQGMIVLSNCDFTSFNDWSSTEDSQTYQDVFRWNSRIPDQELVIDRFRAEGGQFRVFNLTGSSSTEITDNWIVVDRFHHVCSDHFKRNIWSPMGGATWRNGVTVVPNCAPGASPGIQKVVDDTADGAMVAPGARTRRSEFYSCAIVDLRTDANARSRTGNQDREFQPNGFTSLPGAYTGNNILYAPNMVTGGDTSMVPLDTTPQWNSWHTLGAFWQSSTPDTDRAYGHEPTAQFVPQSGSNAIGGATGKVSLLDFNGNVRADVLAGLTRTQPSIGPHEPAIES